MPSFEIILNNDPPMILGGSVLDVLTLGVMSLHDEKKAYLQVTSMDRAANESAILYCRKLSSGDCIEVEFQRNYFQIDPSTVNDLVAKESVTVRRGRVGLALKVDGLGLISASVSDDSMLHVAANWTKARNKCVLEMACIRMTDEGQNQMLIEYEILPGQPFNIRIV